MIAAWERSSLKRPADFYLRKHESRPAAFPFKAEKSGRVCDICGFALAEVELPQGWLLESCSAVGLKRVLGCRRFADWALRLPAATMSGRTADGGQTPPSTGYLPSKSP